MLLKKTLRAMHRYTGDSDGFYRMGEMYYITVEHKRTWRGNYIEVTCRRGYHDELYAGCMPIVYGDEELFSQDWSRV